MRDDEVYRFLRSARAMALHSGLLCALLHGFELSRAADITLRRGSHVSIGPYSR